MTDKYYERNFGSDPEFFIVTQNENNYAVPPAALFEDYKFPLEGETKNGKRIFFSTDDVNFIEDGVAIELNFKQPIKSPELFYKVISNSKVLLENYLYRKSRRLYLNSTAVCLNFDTKKYGKERGEKFLDCIRFGCDADYQPEVYKEFNKGCDIVDSSQHPLRYAGGHLHIQNMSKDEYVYIDQVETFPLVLDLILGTINVLFSRDSQKVKQEKERLKYFGFPGRYRIQNYGEGINGVEYRPPSNVWVNYKTYIQTMFAAGDICGKIIENRLTNEFAPVVMDNLTTFYNGLLLFDVVTCKPFLYKALQKALELNIINISDLTDLKTGIAL